MWKCRQSALKCSKLFQKESCTLNIGDFLISSVICLLKDRTMLFFLSFGNNFNNLSLLNVSALWMGFVSCRQRGRKHCSAGFLLLGFLSPLHLLIHLHRIKNIWVFPQCLLTTELCVRVCVCVPLAYFFLFFIFRLQSHPQSRGPIRSFHAFWFALDV